MPPPEKYYQTALKKDPKNPNLLADYGYHCYLQQRWKEGEANLREAIVLNPELHRAHNNLGLLLARTGRVDEAAKEFVRAGCSEAETHSNLGFALTLQKRFPDAKRQFDLALAADPNSITARNGLKTLKSISPDLEPLETPNLANDGVEKASQKTYVQAKANTSNIQR